MSTAPMKVRFPKVFLNKMDAVIEAGHFMNRNEFIREAIRKEFERRGKNDNA